MKIAGMMLLMVVTFCSCRQKEVTIYPPLSKLGTKEKIKPPVPDLFQMEEIISDLNADGKPDSIIILSRDSTNGFDKVDLKVSNLKPFSFNKEDGYANVDTMFLKRNKNSVNSKNVFVYQNSKDCIIILFSHVYEGGYDGPTIIQISNGKLTVNSANEIEIPIQLSDLNKDGIIDLIGTNWSEMESQVDSLDADIGSYTPYYVYSIKEPFQINMKLTAAYNKEKYVWAGLKEIDKSRVLYYRNGRKPKLIK